MNSYLFLASLRTPKHQEGNGSNIQLYTSNGIVSQKFNFKSAVKSKPIEEGTYVFKSGFNSSYVMDVAGDSSANGANVQLYIGNNTNA